MAPKAAKGKSAAAKAPPDWVTAKARTGAKAKAAPAAGRAVPKAKAKAGLAGGLREKASAAIKRVASAAASGVSKLRKTASFELLEKAKKAARSGSSSSSKGGKKVVDGSVPGAANFKVYEDYSVKLNQTNIDGNSNNNKFYIIQVLEGGGKYHSWNRWGRIGESGASKMTAFSTPESAIKDFESKFSSKTSNKWANRDDFKAVKGKYIIVETEETEGGGSSAPMGKLTEAQIGKGQAVLEKIEAALKKGNKDTLATLSSQYYSLIPQDFGRKRPVSINTAELLQTQIQLLKFFLRMGFEEVEKDSGMTPVDGVMELPVPPTLEAAANSVCGKASIDSSNSQASGLAKKQAGRPVRKMLLQEYASIMLYTSNAIYKDLNKALRDENRGRLKKYFKYLRLFFESMDALPQRKRKLWRGISADLHNSPQYKVGKTIVWWGISSCTSDMNVAKNFAKGCGGKCTLITVESKTAADISDITFYSNEKESLLCPGTQLKVKSNKMNGNVCEITLEEVGRCLN